MRRFNYAKSPDLNMGYYHIQLTEDAINFCTIIIPWVKFCHKSIPMGVRNSPDTFQQKMNDLFQGFEFICAYINGFFKILDRLCT